MFFDFREWLRYHTQHNGDLITRTKPRRFGRGADRIVGFENMKKYNPSQIEPKWQKYWESNKLHTVSDSVAGKENYMLLTEFPYPSGNLHIGHWYAFALPDMRARYLRMKGKNVLYPIGFDAFGLPAENAAIKNDTDPASWTDKNIAYMTKQLQSMGAMFDWSREVQTTDPEYYRWTQWMFLKMYEKGLAYRASTKVNWCPKDKTVLANEQVVNGRCERCESEVGQKEIEQWMFRTTKYADSLADDLENLDWPETTKIAQRNWIGRSEGAIIKFPLVDVPGQPDKKHFVEVFTTRADTIFGATFVVISPELAQKWIDVGWKVSDEVQDYVKKSLSKRDLERMEEKEKTGVFSGVNAINPMSEEKIPVWVADYVLGSYGTGAIMAVPAHDRRDKEFADKFDLQIRLILYSHIDVWDEKTNKEGIRLGSTRTRLSERNVDPNKVNEAFLLALKEQALEDLEQQGVYDGEGYLFDSGKFNGMSSLTARLEIIKELEKLGAGDFKKNYRLRDWVLSRQRYWGVPIPMIKCESCGYIPVPDEELPVVLPKLKDFKPTDDGRSPLAKATAWVHTKCPKCGADAERETDTMDTFVDSSWYFLRYTDSKNKNEFASQGNMKSWLPVPMYVGGAEHNTMHLLYSRFFTKALHELGYVPFNEPFVGRRNHGIILGPNGQKMSKSKGNVVDPDEQVTLYGADTVRMYLAFMAPYEQGGPWDPKGILGVHRFLHRVWHFLSRSLEDKLPTVDSKEIWYALSLANKNISEDLEPLQFNTCISELMKLLNALEKGCPEGNRLDSKAYETLVLLLAPFAPHIAEELWMTVLGKKESVHLESWPEYDEALLVQDNLQIPVQVNGKVRDVITVPTDIKEEELKKTAQESEKIKINISGKKIVKIIVVPKKLINIVIGSD